MKRMAVRNQRTLRRKVLLLFGGVAQHVVIGGEPKYQTDPMDGIVHVVPIVLLLKG